MGAPRTLAKWREMKPIEYLKSKDVRNTWKKELRKLNKEIKLEDLTGEALKLRLYDIFHGVERLEISLASLEEDFKLNYDEIEYAESILKTIRDIVDDRCLLITNILAGSDDHKNKQEALYDSSSGDCYTFLR
jgi:hypothetical protein